MALATFKCARCKKAAKREAAAVNRARHTKVPLFCSRECFGLSRRKGKTKTEKVAEKAAYDREYRAANLAKIKAAKTERHRCTYDPKKAAIERKKRMSRHVEYCRQPEYRAWKRDYDKGYRAKTVYGPFAEAFLTLRDVEAEVHQRASDYEIRTANGTLNKSLKRKRDADSYR